MGATTTGQILKWNGTTWAPAIDDTGSSVTDTEINDGLTDFNSTTGYSVNVDDTTVGIVADAILVKDNGITSTQIAPNTIAASDLSNMGATTTGQILKWNGTAWTPATDDNLSNTDLIQTTGQDRTYDLNGSDLAFVDNSGLPVTGNIGIGNLPGAPQDKLDVDGQIRARNGFAASNGSAGQPSIGFYNDSDTGIYRIAANQLGFSTNGILALTIDASQNIISQANLTVGGTISTVASGQVHPDYVFQKYFLGNSTLNSDYEFKNLRKIEEFIKKNHHLPGLQSAKEINEKGIWNIGEASRINLEKIEELFLHTIEQEKKIKTLEKDKNNLSKELNSLKKEVELIKELLLNK